MSVCRMCVCMRWQVRNRDNKAMLQGQSGRKMWGEMCEIGQAWERIRSRFGWGFRKIG